MKDSAVVLPRRVVPQPTPELVPGGDCGACVLAGALGVTVEKAYELREKREPFHWKQMDAALWTAKRDGLVDRFIADVPMWPQNAHPPFSEWGLHGGLQNLEWHAYVRMAIEAGYYGLAMVDIDKRGPFGGGTNHWVLICGARERWVPFADGGGAHGHNEVLVSCSSRRTPDEEWVDAGDFLKERGGFNVILARPA